MIGARSDEFKLNQKLVTTERGRLPGLPHNTVG